MLKNAILILLLISILCVSLTACKVESISKAATIAPVTKEAKPIEEYYSIFMNEDGTYTIRLLDNNKKVIDELTISKEPHVSQLENGVIQVVISYGSPFYSTYFYDTKAGLISQVYDTPVLVEGGRIITVENNKLIVSDFFNKDLYYKEVSREFSQTVPASSAIISAKFIKANELEISYYEGTGFTEKSEVIDLSNL